MTTDLRSYVPRLVLDWPTGDVHRQVEGTLLFVDLSGFTRLSERLSKRGHVGAEELTGVLDLVFGDLLTVAGSYGGSMLKYGGDALLLFFWHDGHAERGAAAALALQAAIGRVGRVTTDAGAVRLRMSAGAHTGTFDFYLVGRLHRELVVAGAATTCTVAMEAAAEPGQVLVSDALRSRLPGATLAPGGPRGGHLLRRWSADPVGFTPIPEVGADVFVPAALVRHLSAGGHEPEHRQAAVAFVGFTGTDHLSSPDVARHLDTVITTAQEVCEEHEVAFLSTDVAADGGKLILVAGAPRAIEDPEDRLLRTVQAVVRAGSALQARAGVHRGAVFAGDIGPPFRRTYTVIGDAVNTAARVLSRAEPGQVLATPEVLARTATVFAAVPLAPFAAKGKAKPLHASAVGEPTRRRRRIDSREVPFVGRRNEIQQLLDAVMAAERGTGRAFDLVGEPGVGKSRLLSELLRRTAGVEWISVDAEPYDALVPWLQARRLIGPRLGLRLDGSAEQRAHDLRIRVSLAAPHLEPLIPLIGLAFGLELESTEESRALAAASGPSALNTGPAAERLAGARADLFAATIGGPAVIVVDDAQWADPASRRVEAAIAARAANHPWVFVSARRAEGDALPGATPIVVEPLAGADAETLVRAAVNDMLLPQEAADLVDRSGGIPLYALELAAAVREGADDIPDRLESLIAARVDRLAPTDRATLRALAVIGTTFTVPFAERVIPSASTSWPRLSAFVDVSEGRGRFRQPLFRDVAYNGLPFRRRRQLHCDVADLLLATAKPGQEPVESLALHYGRAGDPERAYTYAISAGESGEERYAFLSAARFYADAAEHAARAGRPREIVGARLHDQGRMLIQAGDLRAAESALTAARRHVRRSAERARLCLLQAEVRTRTGRFDAALRWYRRGLTECATIDDPIDAAHERARLQLGEAVVCVEKGRWARAIRVAEQAVANFPPDDESGRGYAFNVLHQAHTGAGTIPPLPYAEMALEIFERLDNQRLAARVLNSLGVAAHKRGEFDRAVELYGRSRAAFIVAGEVLPAAAVANNLAEILVDEGRYAEAGPAFEDALAVAKAAGHRAYVCVILGNLGHLAALEGRFADADELLAEAMAGLDDMGAVAAADDVRARRAERLLLEGRYEEAAAAAAAHEPKVAAPHRPLLLRVRGEAEAGMGDISAARATLRRAFEATRTSSARRDEHLILDALRRLGDAPTDE